MIKVNWWAVTQLVALTALFTIALVWTEMRVL